MKSHSLAPILKKSAEAQAADALRQHVLGGGARPGSRLTEIHLSEAFGLSRATIRTALHQMANEGLVVQVPYIGWEVATLSSQDAWELYTLRSSLESLAARLLIERIDDERINALWRSFDALEATCSAESDEAVANQDLGFHKTIIELSGHRRLRDQFRLVEQSIRLYIAWSDALMPSRDEIVSTHRPIVEAIIARDTPRAEHILRHHNESAGQVLVQFLEAHEASIDTIVGEKPIQATPSDIGADASAPSIHVVE
jgi:DNA-binding GntR family transcriptional regulator